MKKPFCFILRSLDYLMLLGLVATASAWGLRLFSSPDILARSYRSIPIATDAESDR